MGHPHFEHADFLAAARELARENGPAQVTVASVTDRLNAPKGSFYYRFASRDLLLGELWLATALAFQEGFVAAIENEDGLAAALHMPAWVRRNLDDARLLLLYSRHDFVTGDWPESLAAAVTDQARRFEYCLERFAALTWGVVDATSLRLSQFVLADAPLAAVRPHLQRRETPPALVDEIIAVTFRSITRGSPPYPIPGPARAPRRSD
jgi:AcrR family transcriptional regulator